MDMFMMIRVLISVLTRRTLHSPTYSGGVRRSPPESAGLRRTQIPEYLGVTWAKLEIVVQRSPVESGGVYWSLPDSKRTLSGGLRRTHILESTGVCWIPPDSGGLRRTPGDSSGLQGTPVDSSGVRRSPLDSTGVQLRLTGKVMVITYL